MRSLAPPAHLLSGVLLGAVLFVAVEVWTSPARAADGDPPSAAAIEWNDRGLERTAEGRLLEAVLAFEKALEKAPDDATIRTNLAKSRSNLAVQLLDEGDLENATHHAAEAHRLVPDDAVILLNLAACRDAQGYPAKAAELVRKAVATAPKLPSGHERLGAVHYREGRTADAVTSWERAVELGADGEALNRRLDRARRSLAVEGGLRRQLSAHFEVLHDDEGSVLASLVLRELEEIYTVLGADIQHRVERPLKVVLLSKEQFRDATGAHAWVAGLYDGQVRLPLAGADQRPEAVLERARHEYVHAALSPLGKRAPSWLHEGLAQVHEGRSAEKAQARVRRTAPLDYDQLTTSFATTRAEDAARRQYDTALAYVHWLREAERASAFRLAMRRLFEGEGLDPAFDDAYGEKLPALYARFQKQVRGR